jgi:transposase
VGRAVEAVSCYEAGYDGFWLHRRLEAHGVAQLRDRSGKPAGGPPGTTAKTEPTDADRLLRSLMAYRRAEPKVWSVVRVPGIVEEDSRNAFSTSTASPGFAHSMAL